MNIYQKLGVVQGRITVPKSKYNTFGNFKFRSSEDILSSVKPLLQEVGAIITLSDKVKIIEGRFYIIAKAKFVDIETGQSVVTKAMARETESKAKFDSAQLTGSASSYARKYALNGLLAIDDNQDSDSWSGDSVSNDVPPEPPIQLYGVSVEPVVGVYGGEAGSVAANTNQARVEPQEDILTLAKRKGVYAKGYLQKYGVKTFSELSPSSKAAIIQELKGLPDKQ